MSGNDNNSITGQGEKLRKSFASWAFDVLGMGMGTAVGLAIVSFITYTVVGVYELRESNSILSEKVEEAEKISRIREAEGEKRLNQLREEIIRSNQVAIELMMEELSSQEDKKPDRAKEPRPIPPPGMGAVEEFQLRPEPDGDVKADALQHRFRKAQQQIQQQW